MEPVHKCVDRPVAFASTNANGPSSRNTKRPPRTEHSAHSRCIDCLSHWPRLHRVDQFLEFTRISSRWTQIIRSAVSAPRAIVATAASYRSQSLINGVPLTATSEPMNLRAMLGLILITCPTSQREERTKGGGRRMINIPSARRICCGVCLWCSNPVLSHWPAFTIFRRINCTQHNKEWSAWITYVFGEIEKR